MYISCSLWLFPLWISYFCSKRHQHGEKSKGTFFLKIQRETVEGPIDWKQDGGVWSLIRNSAENPRSFARVVTAKPRNPLLTLSINADLSPRKWQSIGLFSRCECIAWTKRLTVVSHLSPFLQAKSCLLHHKAVVLSSQIIVWDCQVALLVMNILIKK